MPPLDLRLRPLAFIDSETTGLDPNTHEIIEFAAIKQYAENDPERRGATLTLRYYFKPQHIERASEEALRVNGYTPEEWEGAHEDIAPVLPDINTFLQGCILVGHNVGFDKKFLDAAFARAGITNTLPYHLVDTVTLAYEHLVPCGLTSLSLNNVCDFLGISNNGAHQALIDAMRCQEVYQLLCNPPWWRRLQWRIKGMRLRRKK